MFVSMINKNVIHALQSPWLIEPTEAQKWAGMALQLLQPLSVTTPINRNANEESQPFVKNGVFVLPVNGPLMKYENCGSPGTSNMLASFNQAVADPNISSIVLQIDSPGGTVDGTKVFSDAIKQSSKPVVAFVDGMMASAAMWIGSAASEIIASTPTDMIGSIGTMVQWADFTEAYKAKGIKMHTAYASQSVDKNKTFSNAQESGNYTELITSVLDPINDQFTSAISQNRNGKINLSKENVLTGKTYMAKDAIKYGLADKIGSLDMAIKRANALASAKQKTMEQAQSAFAHTLTAANAESFELIDNVGFALTEENLNNVEAHLVSMQAINTALEASAVTDAAAVQTATEAAETSASLLVIAQEKITQLNAKIVSLGGKPAAVQPNPGAVADPAPAAETFLTSTDKLVAERKKKYAY